MFNISISEIFPPDTLQPYTGAQPIASIGSQTSPFFTLFDGVELQYQEFGNVRMLDYQASGTVVAIGCMWYKTQGNTLPRVYYGGKGGALRATEIGCVYAAGVPPAPVTAAGPSATYSQIQNSDLTSGSMVAGARLNALTRSSRW